jgi:hypothetical protein
MWHSRCPEGPRRLMNSLRRVPWLFHPAGSAGGCSAIVLSLLVLIGNGELGADDKVPAAKPQPLPFSHKLHTQFFPECLDCHQLSADGWTMSYPREEQCMVCHATIKGEDPAIQKLAAYAAQKKPVPWVQVYRVPDYVYFSHRTHIKKAKLDCEGCHGPVREREVITKEKDTSMQGCISCHKEKGAPVGCRTCHDTI